MMSDNKPDWWKYLVEPQVPKGKNFDLAILLGAIVTVVVLIVFLIILL